PPVSPALHHATPRSPTPRHLPRVARRGPPQFLMTCIFEPHRAALAAASGSLAPVIRRAATRCRAFHTTFPPPSPTAATCSDGCQMRSEEHTSELQSRFELVCRLLPEKKKPPPQ